MSNVYVLLLVCAILAIFAQKMAIYKEKEGVLLAESASKPNYAILMILLYLIMFAGLRTHMNDTYAYIVGFERTANSIDGFNSINWIPGAHPLFHLFQLFIKVFISDNPQVLFLITACIVETSMVTFLYKYSRSFSISLYMFIAFATFGFTMAAMKQTIATSIAIWSIPEFAKKKNHIAMLIIAVAALFHPYTIIFVSALFLCGHGIWNRRVYIVIIVTILFGITFSWAIGGILSLTETIGRSYNSMWLEEGTGVSVFRVIAYLVFPFLSFLNRKIERLNGDSIQDIFINLSVVAGCLSFLSGIGGAVLLGRMPNYFDICICIAAGYILTEESYFANYRKIVQLVVVMAFLFYYITYYNKFYGSFFNSFRYDIYNHVSIFDVLRNW